MAAQMIVRSTIERGMKVRHIGEYNGVRYAHDMAKETAIVRFTGNHQVSIPKRVREAVGLSLGDFVEVTAEGGVIVMRPKQLTNKPLRKGTATAAELRTIKRGLADVAAGETMPYEQYRAERRARLERKRRKKSTKTAR